MDMKTRSSNGQSLFTLSASLLVGGAVPMFALWCIATDMVERQMTPRTVSAEGDARVATIRQTREERLHNRQLRSEEAVEKESESAAFVKVNPALDRQIKERAAAARQDAALAARATAGRAFGVEHDLRVDLLATAQDLAVRSETPWLSLAEVAVSQQRAGFQSDSDDTFELAITLAGDPDDPEKAISAGEDVLRSLLKAGKLERALEFATTTRHQRGLRFVAAEQARTMSARDAVGTALLIDDEAERDSALSAIAETVARHNSAGEAIDTAARMQHPQRMADALKRSALARLKVGDAQGAEKLVALIPDQDRRIAAIERLAAEHSRRGSIGAAESLLATISDTAMRDRLLSRFAADRANRKDGDALGTAFRIHDVQRRLSALRSLAKIEASDGNTRAALSITRLISEPQEKSVALRDVAVSSVSAEGASRARSLVNRISEEDVRDEALAAVAVAIQKSWHDADEAWDTARMVREPVQRAMALADIASEVAQKGDAHTAGQLLREAENGARRLPIDEKSARRDRLNVSMARAYVETEQDEAAIESASTVSHEGQRDRALQDLSERFARDAKIGYAIASSSRIAREGQRDSARARAIQIFARTVKPEDAFRAVERLPSRNDRVSFLVAVASRI